MNRGTMKTLISEYKIIALSVIFFFHPFFCYGAEIISFEYPPYLDFDNKGIFANINDEINSVSEEEFSVTPLPRKRAVQLFEKQKNLIFIGEKRYFRGKDKYLRSCPIMESGLVLVYLKSRQEELSFSDIEDLKGKKVGVSLGSNLTPVFTDKGIIVEEWSRLEGNIKKLDFERIDYWGTTDITASALINRYFKNQKDKFVVQGFSKPFVIEAVAWKDSEGDKMLDIYCRALGKLKKNGRLEKIIGNFSYEEAGY